MYLTEELQKKWQPVLEHPELESITDPYKKAVTALVLENQQQAMNQDRQALNESPTGGSTVANATGAGISNFDPINGTGKLNLNPNASEKTKLALAGKKYKEVYNKLLDSYILKAKAYQVTAKK
jgi:hypothetical protein